MRKISVATLGMDEDTYFDEKEFYQGEIPELYRDFEIYYSAPNGGITHIDCLSLEHGCYAITNDPEDQPFWELADDELEAIAKNFINGVLQSEAMTHAINGQLSLF